MSVSGAAGSSNSQSTSLPQPSGGLGPTDQTAEAVNEVATDRLREAASSESSSDTETSHLWTLANVAHNSQDPDYSAIVAFFKEHLNEKIRKLANTVETVTKETILITSKKDWQNDLGNSSLLATEIMTFLNQFRSEKNPSKYALEKYMNAQLQEETFVEKQIATDGSRAELHIYWVLELDSHLKNGRWAAVSDTYTIEVQWLCSDGRRSNGYNISVKLSWIKEPCNGIEVSRPPDKAQDRRILILPVTIAQVIQQKIPRCQFHQLPLFLCKRCRKIRLAADRKEGSVQCCVQTYKRKPDARSQGGVPTSPKASRPSGAEQKESI